MRDLVKDVISCHYVIVTQSSDRNLRNKATEVPASKVLLAGPDFIKKNSCSTQQSIKFFLLINVKTTVGILTFMSRKNSILGLSEPEK